MPPRPPAAPPAVLIAGGQGTRIRSIGGERRPKALVPVAGRPVVFRQLDLLRRYGVREVVVLAGHLAEVLLPALEAEARSLGISTRAFVETEPLGTAGGLPAALEALPADGPFLVLYADVAVEMDLPRLLRFHEARGAVATIVAHPNDHPHESDLLRTDPSGRVTAILRREGRAPGDHGNLVPAAVYCLSPVVFHHVLPGVRQDFVRDVFPRLIDAGCQVVAYDTPEYLKDMGTIERHAAVERDILSGRMAAMNLERARPAVFFDRDGTLNRAVPGHGVLRHEQLELLPGAAEAVRAVNREGWLAVLVTNQPQLAKGLMDAAELEWTQARLETLLGREGALLDRTYLCPHHPERGHSGEVEALKVDCDCRKPRPGLLRRAADELHVDLARSCVIGDTHRDVGAARALGLDAYGVRTGVGCRDCGGDLRPDALFADVLEAVRFALHGCAATPDLVSRTEALLERVAGRPVVVATCGPSRAGKSVLAHDLKRRLGGRGHAVALVPLDDWIVPRSERSVDMGPRERARVEAQAAVVDALIAGREVEAPGYFAATREAGAARRHSAAGARVLLLDGQLSCDPALRDRVDLAVHVTASREVLASRLADFYHWKGDDEDAVREMIAARLDHDLALVEGQQASADVVVDLGGWPELGDGAGHSGPV